MRPFHVFHGLVSLFLIAGRATGTRRTTVRGSASAGAEDAKRGQLVPHIWRSASHFYGHDLPKDFSPPADKLEKDFTHPYPVIQESSVFDKDFVKDENEDDGRWKAQMDYDKLRTEVDKLASQSSRILSRKLELEKQLQAAQAQEDSVRKELKKTVRDDAPPPAPPVSQDTNVNASVGVGPATDEVEQRLQEIERCKKELALVQKQLKQLQELLEQAQKEQEAALAKQKQAEWHASVTEEQARLMGTKVQAAGQAHTSALQAFQRQKQELEDLKRRIAEARARLMKMQYKTVDQDGGVYKTNFAQPSTTPKKQSAARGNAALCWSILALGPVAAILSSAL